MWPLARLKPYERNARTHSPEQVAQIAASMREWGFTNPVLAQPDGTIIAGHGRVLAAQANGYPEAPVMVAQGWTDAQIRAYVIADNQLALNAGWDDGLLKLELEAIQLGGFDISLTGFSVDELKGLSLGGGAAGMTPSEAKLKLAERFGVVPFSVLNAREGWWQDRKAAWLALGIESEVGRGENLLKFSDTINEPDPAKRARKKNGKRAAATFGQDLMKGEGKFGPAQSKR